ncbi:hypothetical protein [Sphingobium sp. SYK-6]|uniref:hypothetical protein n=1 Tax=Sphingobium sp. (strain NBRC 103272 / SYK-6) TaxID=627192 RepID=UPI00059DB308|nr:hypothetical protein [Sphingobium sp. SYK-6]
MPNDPLAAAADQPGTGRAPMRVFSPAARGHLAFEVRERDGCVRVFGAGLWSPDEAQAHFRALEQTILKLRRERAPVRVLVNLREAAVQTAQTADLMRTWTARIYRAADRVAVVCATTLLALQIRHVANVPNLATFQDVFLAEEWIGEPDPA